MSRSGDDSSRRSPRGDATAYHSDESGNFDIWVKRTDGGTSTNLTVDHPGTDKNPSWSPDGTRIAFFSEREGGGYFTVFSTGGPARRVPGWDASTLGPPVWSPDGAALAWVSSRSSETAGRTEAFVHIHSIEEGGVKVLPIPENSDWRFDLSWSPDGHRLHLLQQRAGAVDLKEQR
jgi:Tol biopolymer transport system component